MDIDGLKQNYREQIVKAQGARTGIEYAKALGVTESRLSNLRNGQLYGFSLESLMQLAARANSL